MTDDHFYSIGYNRIHTSFKCKRVFAKRNTAANNNDGSLSALLYDLR